MNTSSTLGSVLHAYFEDYLCCQKGVRIATIRSYRDSVKLFLQFVSGDTKIKMTRLRLSDLTGDRVVRFLRHLEVQRGNSIATRNQRLAAVRGLFEYVAIHVPETLEEAHRVANVPCKRTQPPQTGYLERDQIELLFKNMPDTGQPLAIRDRAMMLFLYNTGARAQEVADLRAGNLELTGKPYVHLHGKGDKWRTCPLWEKTANSLKGILGESIQVPDAAVFVSRSGSPLTRFGIYKIVRRNVAKSNICSKTPISTHSFRHTAAVHLLESGVDINVIRAWLGHVSLDTTNRYAEISIQMKAKALAACHPPTNATGDPFRKPKWQDDQELLNWLQSL